MELSILGIFIRERRICGMSKTTMIHSNRMSGLRLQMRELAVQIERKDTELFLTDGGMDPVLSCCPLVNTYNRT